MGYFTTRIWQEKTPPKAFFIGLALPYLLTGMIADAQGLRGVRRAGGEESASNAARVAEPKAFSADEWDKLGELKVTIATNGKLPAQYVVSAVSVEPLQKAPEIWETVDVRLTIRSVTSLLSESLIALPPGSYQLTLSAPG